MMENKEREKTEKLAWIGREILLLTRNELYLQMRFLDVAVSSFVYEMNLRAEPAGTDGLVMYYHPGRIGGLYKERHVDLCRLYLHMVLHCIFRHLTRRNGREQRLWELSCDIAAESIIDSMHVRAVRKAQSWLRQNTYRNLRKRLKVLTADKIYGILEKEEGIQQQLCRLEQEFQRDSHLYWPGDDEEKKKQEIENQWKNQSERLETEMETFAKEASSSAGDLLAQVKVENKERFDYREFLRKFAVLREENCVDEDSFDYIFYSYGLSLYGNMPLVEPLEWKETKKIEEFVIVVDTSMSCSGELVRKFLEETYSVLREQDSYFQKIHIHILQCDDRVQEDRRIESREELKEYMEHLELRGEGGTDFRPAFAYVQEMLEKQEFRQLRGLLYFTDGQGIYPKQMPPYQTAFVFLKEDYEDAAVPPWAIKVILEEDLEKPVDKGE